MNFDEKHYPKVVALVGPTASGKSTWAIRLAKKFNGEIISADSRQIYKKMDIGTAKEPGEWRREGLHKTYYVQDVAHHLVDFLDPGKAFTVSEFRDKASKYCEQIIKKGKLPILAGGTGLYVHTLVDNLQIPQVPPNRKLRQSLEPKNNEELTKWLSSLDPKSAETVDCNNKRRLIRALEVCILSGVPFSEQQKKGEKIFDFLQIGIEAPREVLYERIDLRVQNMFDQGLVKEVEALMRQKYSWELPSMSGIGYRQFKDYFAKQLTLEEVKENLKRDTRHYAKRQFTWFKRDERVKWISDYEEAEKLVEEFLKI